MSAGGIPTLVRNPVLVTPVRGARRFIGAYGPAGLLLVLMVVLWEVLVRAMDIRPYLLPAPSRIWTAFLDTREVLPGHTWTTLQEALLGIAIGAAVGIALASLIASISLVRRVLYPLLVVSQTIPLVVLAPLLVIWFGIGITPKVLLVAVITFFPVVVSTAEALLNADRELIGLVRSMGANRWQTLRHVLIPSAIPAFFAGLKIASAYAVAGAVIAEWVGAGSGLGLYINRSTAAFRTDQVFVAVVVIALMSMALFATVHILSRLATPWAHIREGENS
jgi:ABC-type nitrate/sulfonate/bicarbonate transport system permease component